MKNKMKNMKFPDFGGEKWYWKMII
jgi:hypothetical protein